MGGQCPRSLSRGHVTKAYRRGAEGLDRQSQTVTLTGSGTFVSAVTVTNIDALRFVDPGDANQRQFQTTADQIGTGGLSLTLAVEGSATTNTESIRITRGGTAAVDLDLSGWTFTSFGTNRQITVDLFNSEVAAN